MAGIVLLLLTALSFAPLRDTRMKFNAPKNWPKPHYDFTQNPLTQEGFELGRKLFYDPILSRDSTISCASCHLQATGFTHVDHALSHGIDSRVGTRNSMTLINLAWGKYFMWDGGVNHLDVQAMAPITSAPEMDEQLDNVVRKLNASERYKKDFNKVYGKGEVTSKKMLLALTQFLVQLNSYNSKYDKYIRKEKGGEMTSQELNGLEIFRANCSSCHTEPLFTNGEFENNGLPVDTGLLDFGRMKITSLPADSLKFKVPTLRNIQFTQPYMHDGRFKKLLQVINHYTDGVQRSPTLSTHLQKPITLTHEQKIDLTAFLLTLTDKEFLFDKRFSFPRE